MHFTQKYRSGHCYNYTFRFITVIISTLYFIFHAVMPTHAEYYMKAILLFRIDLYILILYNTSSQKLFPFIIFLSAIAILENSLRHSASSR